MIKKFLARAQQVCFIVLLVGFSLCFFAVCAMRELPIRNRSSLLMERDGLQRLIAENKDIVRDKQAHSYTACDRELYCALAGVSMWTTGHMSYYCQWPFALLTNTLCIRAWKKTDSSSCCETLILSSVNERLKKEIERINQELERS